MLLIYIFELFCTTSNAITVGINNAESFSVIYSSVIDDLKTRS